MYDTLLTVYSAIKSSRPAPTPTLTHVIPSLGRGGVCAVTSLGDDVFLVRDNSPLVEVYDVVTLTFQRYITVDRIGYPRGLVACRNNNCLYASDFNSNIHRVELSGSNAVKEWHVGVQPTGLSVNIAHNLVVACYEANKLQEYTTHGSFVREICLQSGVNHPYHAIQLSTGDYVVSQFTLPSGVVGVVGVDGQVIHRCGYGQSRLSNVCPTSLAVTKNDDILVADQLYNRILSINRSMGCVQELAVSVDGGIQEPRGLCLDESRGRLYVGECGEQCQVLVFDGVRF